MHYYYHILIFIEFILKLRQKIFFILIIITNRSKGYYFLIGTIFPL